MIDHTRCQHPVGQGAFHSGTIEIGNAKLRYVYDCGSDNAKARRAAISDFLRAGKRPSGSKDGLRSLDILFLSHLDRDHINGVDQLLGLVSVHTLVLPYMEPFERLMLVARAIDDGAGDGSFVRLIANPPDWFGQRGVRRIVYVRGTSEPEGAAPDLPTNPLIPESAETIELDLQYLADNAERVPEKPDAPLQFIIKDICPLRLKAGKDVLDWVLLTFVHPEPDRIEDFQKCVCEAFAWSVEEWTDKINDANAMGRLVRERDLRQKLRKCYREIRSDRNLTSLCLYSGPVTKRRIDYDTTPLWRPAGADRWRIGELVWLTKHRVRNSFRLGANLLAKLDIELPYFLRHASLSPAGGGWMGTGDAHLDRKNRRSRYLSHYKALLDNVTTLLLPHHGSGHNFHRDILAGKNLSVCVPSADEDSQHGHPDRVVIIAIARHGSVFAHTSEKASTTLCERVTVRSQLSPPRCRPKDRP